MDELSFGIWKRENPNGRVLQPDQKLLEAQHYESADWEKQVGKMRVTTSAQLDSVLEPRALIVGIKEGGQSKAYLFSAIEKEGPVLDMIGGTYIVIFVGDDKKSVRAFEREIDDRMLEFFVKPDSSEIVDAETGSTWDFSGKAVAGELSGKQLKRVAVIKDYWFDWKTYHPDTQLYTAGSR
jgi:hypothetical protein